MTDQAPPRDPRLGHVRNLIGRTSGTLIVRAYTTTRRQGNDRALAMAMWECECTECGAIVVKQRRHIVAGTASCTCARRIRKDLSGQRFGRLLVTGPAPMREGKVTWWRVRCDCGTEKEVRRDGLTHGSTRSCGCLFRELAPERLEKSIAARWPDRRR